MVRISTPAIVWALSIASLIERTVQSMLATIPLRRPRQGTVPTPRMVIPSAPSTSATTAQTFVVPMSRPTTISPCEAAVLIVWGNRTAAARGPTFGAARARESQGEEEGRSRAIRMGFLGSLPPFLPVSLSCPSLPHADDDAVGAGVVVEHDGAGPGAPLVELGDDARRLIELAAKGRSPQHELEGAMPDDEGEDAVGLDVDLLERLALRQRGPLELRGQV